MATGYHYDAAKAINETCSGRRFGPTVPPTINIELAVQILRDDAIVRPVRQLGDGGAR
jgi:hypothetical protein